MPSLDYIAGFFDGDGFFRINRSIRYGKYPNYSCAIGIVNTNVDILDSIQATLAYYNVESKVYIKCEETSRHRVTYTLWIQKVTEVLKFCALIGTRLYIKKTRAVVITEYASIGRNEKCSKERERLWRIMRELNKRGPKDGEN